MQDFIDTTINAVSFEPINFDIFCFLKIREILINSNANENTIYYCSQVFRGVITVSHISRDLVSGFLTMGNVEDILDRWSH